MGPSEYVSQALPAARQDLVERLGAALSEYRAAGVVAAIRSKYPTSRLPPPQLRSILFQTADVRLTRV